MTELERFRQMTTAADAERPPRVDPTAGVMAEIERRRNLPGRRLWAAAAAAGAVAAGLASAALLLWQNWQVPLDDWFALYPMVMI